MERGGEVSTARPRTSSPQKCVFADDKSKHKHAQPFVTRTNLLILALYMSHSDGSFGYRGIAATAIHAVCVFVLGSLTTTVVGTHGLDRFHGERNKMSNVHENRRSLYYCSRRPPVTKSPFLSMTNQNTTSPALYHQNQPPDLGSVHQSQRRKLWLSRHRSHRHTCCVCFCFRVSYIFSWRKEAKPLLLVLRPPKVRFC